MTAKIALNEASDIRPGEVSVPLPAETDAGVYFIGRIHTPWKTRKDCPKNARASRCGTGVIRTSPGTSGKALSGKKWQSIGAETVLA